MLLNCDVRKDSWESLELQGDPNQSILKEISPEYSLEGLMLKLKLQYFGHLMGRANSLEKTLMLGKIEDRRRRGQQWMRWLGWHHQLNGHEFDQALGVSDEQGSLVCCSPWGRKESDTERLNWTEIFFQRILQLLSYIWIWGEGMATHSSILAWRIPMDSGSSVGYNPWDCRVRHNLVSKHSTT